MRATNRESRSSYEIHIKLSYNDPDPDPDHDNDNDNGVPDRQLAVYSLFRSSRGLTVLVASTQIECGVGIRVQKRTRATFVNELLEITVSL
jgi:hypothetical protein